MGITDNFTEPLREAFNYVTTSITKIVSPVVKEALTAVTTNVIGPIMDLRPAGWSGGDLIEAIKSSTLIFPLIDSVTDLGTNKRQYMHMLDEYYSLSAGGLGLEFGKTEVAPGLTSLGYGLHYTKKPIVISIGAKMFPIYIPIPTGGIKHYDISIPIKFDKTIKLGKLSFNTPKILGNSYHIGSIDFGSINLGMDKKINIKGIPFLKFTIFSPKIPALALPIKRTEQYVTVASASIDEVPLYFVVIGKMRAWWYKYIPFLSGERDTCRMPMAIIPTMEDVERLVNEKLAEKRSVQ